jgi:hypothetical protein
LIEIWNRNSFDVEAVQVTEENISKVAKWCGCGVWGAISEGDSFSPYLVIGEMYSGFHRETKVFVGDWIVSVEGEFRRYTDDTFRLNYSKGKANLSEADIRRIIREELKKFSQSVSEYASTSSGDSDAEYDALKIVDSLFGFEGRILPHDWNCALRKYGLKKCDCGVGENE